MRNTILSAVTVTNRLQLGNYLGALKNWKKLQDQYDCFFFAADLHALTSKHDALELKEQTLINIATYVACGIDPNRATIFRQSDVPEHTQLTWVLTCLASMGELSRMTQYKDKSEKAGQHIPAGLFTYPILMAADILLYDANLVPVGADQKQHLELTRDLAERANSQLGKDTFVVPNVFTGEAGARIMDLQDPEAKMSKSATSELGVIFLSDTPSEIEKKFKRAVTDSGSEILHRDDKPGVRNLLEIQMTLTGKKISELEASYQGKQYGHLKIDTAALVIEALAPIQNRLKELLSDRAELENLVKRGKEKAQERAAKTLERVYVRLGLK